MERLAFGRGNEVALASEVCGKQVGRVLVGRVHEGELAIGVAHAGNGVVEEGHWDVRVALLAHMDENGEGVGSG